MHLHGTGKDEREYATAAFACKRQCIDIIILYTEAGKYEFMHALAFAVQLWQAYCAHHNPVAVRRGKEVIDD
ncbi:MAG: hypothetical protein A2Y38_15970 [Spirochaetes bacterium GWB1_59_5]|nr:MAG: hypothetical protein A2Y38_15970 [Spirochaetes bacterium GWB1_59_5]